MNKLVNPKAVHAPLGAYTHSIKVPRDAEWLVVAGQVGMNAKGQVLDGIRKQAEQAFRNIPACLKESGMRKNNLVKFNVYLTDSRHIDPYRAARKKVIGDATQPASTLLVIDGLASPDLLIEVEAWAAKA
jgi:enamine deaminase RidA (YjgF/YER057c/UK114 family)